MERRRLARQARCAVLGGDRVTYVVPSWWNDDEEEDSQPAAPFVGPSLDALTLAPLVEPSLDAITLASLVEPSLAAITLAPPPPPTSPPSPPKANAANRIGEPGSRPAGLGLREHLAELGMVLDLPPKPSGPPKPKPSTSKTSAKPPKTPKPSDSLRSRGRPTRPTGVKAGTREALPAESETRRPRWPFAFVLAFGGLAVGYKLLATPASTVPEALRGEWITSFPTYTGRSLAFNPDEIIFGDAPGAAPSRYHVTRVNAVGAGDTTELRLTYRADDTNVELSATLINGPQPRLRFAIPDGLEWYRKQ